jgi:hypothetical protein
MAIRVRHLVMQMLIVVPLHELNALILDSQIVTIRGQVSAGSLADASVVEYWHSIQTVDFLPYTVMRIPIEQRRSFP